jgi:hypothetical protein
MLSRKYYKAIASAIKDSTWSGTTNHSGEERVEVDLDDLLIRLCAVFSEDNPNFNPTKFKEACR